MKWMWRTSGLFAAARVPRRGRRAASSLAELAGKSNVVLLGPPGCGKTSVGVLLGERLGMPIVDIDNDHLEKRWGMSVADKLSQMGDEGFLDAEDQALQELSVRNTILSLTGSNALREGGMTHVARDGVVVYLDVKHQDIIARMERMKVDRIVGQASKVRRDRRVQGSFGGRGGGGGGRGVVSKCSPPCLHAFLSARLPICLYVHSHCLRS